MKEPAKIELLQTSIAVLDSQTAIAAEGFIALAEVIKAAALADSILRIKPILTVSPRLVYFAGVARSKKSGVVPL